MLRDKTKQVLNNENYRLKFISSSIIILIVNIKYFFPNKQLEKDEQCYDDEWEITMVRSNAITESSVWTPKKKHVNLSYSSQQIFGIKFAKKKNRKLQPE